MRDSLQKVTTALTGGLGTTVNSLSIKLGHDNTAQAVGGPVWYGYDVELRYPITPTGTTPTIAATLQDSLDDSTFASRAVFPPRTGAADTFPKLDSLRFVPRKGAKSFRIQYVLGNTNNVFGSVEAAITGGNNSRNY